MLNSVPSSGRGSALIPSGTLDPAWRAEESSNWGVMSNTPLVRDEGNAVEVEVEFEATC